MTSKLNHLLVVLLAINVLVPINVFGQSKLQQYLDKLANSQSVGTRASTTPTDIDLSEFDSDITETVYVRNGINVRFVNGEIVRNASLNAPLIKVQDNSKLTIGYGAVLKDGGSNTAAIVLVDGGSLYSQSGVIEDYGYKSTQTRTTIEVPQKVPYVSVELTNETDIFEMTGGEVGWIQGKNGIVKLSEGSSSIVNGSNITITGKNTIKRYINLWNSGKVSLTSSIIQKVVIRTAKTTGEAVMIGHSYDITESDLKYISVENLEGNTYVEAKIKLVDNSVVIAEGDGIKDAQTLQEALDAVAAKNINPWERETIEIPAEGIEIDKSIYFRKNCRVKLTGGPIKISSDFKTNPTIAYPYYVFFTEKESAVEFENITLDFNNNNIFKRALFEINGMFAIKDKVEFKNIDKNIDLLYGVFYMKDGCHFTYDNYKSEIQVNPTVFYGEGVQEAYFTGYATSYTKPVVNTQSIFNVEGGKIQSNNASYSIKCKYLHVGGSAYITALGETVAEVETINIDGGYINGKKLEAENITITKDGFYDHHFYLDKIAVKKYLTLYGNLNIECPVSFENTDSRISINQAITCSAKIKFISPCWKDLLKKPLIFGTSNYALPDDILDNFDFSDSKYDAMLDKANNYIYLKKKCLSCFLNELSGGDTGTEEDPIDIDLPDEEEVEDDTHFPGDLQAFLDGLADKENDDNTPKSLKLRGGSLFIDPGCTITIRNYILDGCSSGKRIYVDGTLVIDINVYIRYFSDYFIYVRKGGRVIWRGGKTELINKVVYNNGGTVIIKGGQINSNNGSAIVNVGGTIEIYNGDDGSSTTISGSIDNGDKTNGGTIHYYGGTHHGHITNYGTIVISDGNFSNGGSTSTTITNYGEYRMEGGTVEGFTYSYSDFYLCGCANVGDIYLRGGSKIYITERLTVKIRIHVFIDGTIGDRSCIAIGPGGYVLTEEDLKLIELVLPEGYEWEYDKTQNAIIIKSMTGINDVEIDSNSAPSNVYTLKGVKVGKTTDKNIPKGIYVIDGKKTVLNSEK